MDRAGAYFRKSSQMSVKAAWLLSSGRGIKIPARKDLHQSVDANWNAPPFCFVEITIREYPGSFGATAVSTVLVNSSASLAKIPRPPHSRNRGEKLESNSEEA